MSNIISFAIEEINEMLTYLGKVPAEHSFDLITYIRGKANEEIAAQNVPAVVAPVAPVAPVVEVAAPVAPVASPAVVDVVVETPAQ